MSEPQTALGRWPLFLFGFLIFIAGPVMNAVQMQMGDLSTPWHVPILGSIGVFFMLLSVLARGGVLRIIGLIFFALFCAFEWFFVLVFTVTPAYAGTVREGQPFPAFTAALADGKPFTDAELKNDKATILVFFRGRW
jgi:hypothetical protein